MAKWESEIQSRQRSMVQGIQWQIIPPPVTAIVGEPEIAGHRMPVESHRITNTIRINLQAAAIWFHPHDRGVSPIFILAHIAWFPHRHIQPFVRSESDVFPTVMLILRKSIVHQHWLRRILHGLFDIV